MQKATLYLLCGKAASGKSTLAAELAQKHGAILLAEDDFLPVLYGDVLKTLKDYVDYSAKLKAAIKPVILQLISRDIPVVLDFPANTKKQRQWLKSLFQAAGCPHQLYFMDVPNGECKKRLLKRNEEGLHHFTMTEEQFDQLTGYFEPPLDEEGFEVIIYKT